MTERINTWTLAYRKAKANKFHRVIDWSGTWAEAHDMAAVAAAQHPELQIYYTSTKAAEDSGSVHAVDCGNLLMDNGKRVRMTETGFIADIVAEPQTALPLAVTDKRAWGYDKDAAAAAIAEYRAESPEIHETKFVTLACKRHGLSSTTREMGSAAFDCYVCAIEAATLAKRAAAAARASIDALMAPAAVTITKGTRFNTATRKAMVATMVPNALGDFMARALSGKEIVVNVRDVTEANVAKVDVDEDEPKGTLKRYMVSWHRSHPASGINRTECMTETGYSTTADFGTMIAIRHGLDPITVVVDSWRRVGAMTARELRAWLTLHGVTPADIDEQMIRYAGKTRDEMEAINDELHGSMA